SEPVAQYDLLHRPGEGPRRIYNLPAPPLNLEAHAEATGKALPAPVKAAPPPVKVEESPPANDRIRFFEMSDVGLELATAERHLLIRSLRPGSPLAKAGLKVG